MTKTKKERFKNSRKLFILKNKQLSANQIQKHFKKQKRSIGRKTLLLEIRTIRKIKKVSRPKRFIPIKYRKTKTITSKRKKTRVETQKIKVSHRGGFYFIAQYRDKTTGKDYFFKYEKKDQLTKGLNELLENYSLLEKNLTLIDKTRKKFVSQEFIAPGFKV